MFFDSWFGLLRVLVAGALAYVGLVALLRISGNRTLSKMNAFDLVVTVALGSTLATIILSKDVALAEGLAAFATLIGLQFLITWLSVRSTTVSRLIKAEPRLLVFRGQVLGAQMRAARVVESEIDAALREHGLGSLEQAAAVILETDGTFSIVPRPDSAGGPGKGCRQRGESDPLGVVPKPEASRAPS